MGRRPVDGAVQCLFHAVGDALQHPLRPRQGIPIRSSYMDAIGAAGRALELVPLDAHTRLAADIFLSKAHRNVSAISSNSMWSIPISLAEAAT